MEKTSCFMPAHILLPDASVPLGQWGCIACDQFTSDRDYWAKAEQAAAGGPSALRLILPEVYLGESDQQARVDQIHKAMEQYDREVLTRAVDGFVYVERTLQSGRVRQGLVGRVDLEAYNYHLGSLPLVRPSEHTVEERIPPRMAVRRDARLETPHVMMLADDPDRLLIEPVGRQKEKLRPLYDGELMLGGGHVAGWAVEDPALIRQIEDAMEVLSSQETFLAKYPGAPNDRPMALAVGDGNHSLATAKAYWEELKKTLTPQQQKDHPARWCLAEVCNVRSDAVEIEPIHRVLFNTSYDTVLLNLVTWSDENLAGIRFGDSFEQKLQLMGPRDRCHLSFENPSAPLGVGTVDEFVEYFLENHPEARVDYVHDEAAVRSFCEKEGAVGMLLPAMRKGDLFRGVVLGGVLPRKTFSLGHAEEKRYYIECRRIAE